MDLNVSKSEVSFYSKSATEAKWPPNMEVAGESIPYNECPKFLGVHLDRSLAFQKHVDSDYVTNALYSTMQHQHGNPGSPTLV